MNRILVLAIAICFPLLMSVNAAIAGPFGMEITIFDKNSGTGSDWYGNREDQEVEPGMIANQVWDLEGFFLNGTTLTMIGGYDLKNGEDGILSGDIFIDINGDAVYGDINGTTNGNVDVLNSYGYDYVLDLDFNSLTFIAYAIDESAVVSTAFYKQNQGSSPWLYVCGGKQITGDALGFSYDFGLTDADTGFFGTNHNALTVDLSFLNDIHHGTQFTSHYTMGCGNDNLMGAGQLPAPEPATLILMGCGLIGVAGIIRKKHSVSPAEGLSCLGFQD